MITASKGIESLLGIDFLKTNKCLLNLHEELLKSSQCEISIPLSREKTHVAQVFAVLGENTFIKSKN